MEKVKFDKQETINLLKMLTSTDTENQVIALKALNNADLENYFGELLVLYKYSKISPILWEKECPNAWNKLQFHLSNLNLTSGKCLSILIENKSSKASLELYLEFFVSSMIGFMEQLGYPTDKFNINFELKE